MPRGAVGLEAVSRMRLPHEMGGVRRRVHRGKCFAAQAVEEGGAAMRVPGDEAAGGAGQSVAAQQQQQQQQQQQHVPLLSQAVHAGCFTLVDAVHWVQAWEVSGRHARCTLARSLARDD